ncbi:uncharacterized protein BYT42DRAFT_586642 [Radiomyces spectabilis]|uniref:uncharacterized protein n=1 Tax=Radiomyces spectabilis TaxID=64574 RepID=UPI0022207665|nr:uncharacterized protein BYT42DRAFT_586642 [Radiomyces spectabilis]KAI8367539.1 hypothetical protein BYT42DRAFT_586642 [Radiomyces spectabilis]
MLFPSTLVVTPLSRLHGKFLFIPYQNAKYMLTIRYIYVKVPSLWLSPLFAKLHTNNST